MSNRILDYPEATGITSDDYILLDNAGTGAKCLKASALNINMDNYTIKEARGSIASFDDGEDLPLAFMGAYITAIQEGSGDPSPTNVRPILGFSGVEVTNMDDISDKAFFDGLLNGTYGIVDLGTLDWQYSSIAEKFYASATALGVKATDVSTPFNAISSALIAKSYNEIDAKTVDYAIGINPNATQFFARCSSITSASAFITAMNGVHLIYELATPTTPTITPSELNQLYEEFGINGNTYSLIFTDAQGNPIKVYGGYVDVVSGELVVDRVEVDLGTLNWVYISETNRERFSALLRGVKWVSDAIPINAICSALVVTDFYSVYSHITDNSIGMWNGTTLAVNSSAYTDVETFKQAMNGVQLVYELATPLTYQLSKQQIKSLVGENNFFANTGDSIVDYRKRWVKPEM